MRTEKYIIFRCKQTLQILYLFSSTSTNISNAHHILANNLYVLASRLICLTAAMAAMTARTEKTTAMAVFNQNIRLLFDGLNVKLKKITGNIKSSGMNPKAPMTELMSPKNGSIAAIVVAMMTEQDRETSLGKTFLGENSLLVGSANARSRTSFVGCK